MRKPRITKSAKLSVERVPFGARADYPDQVVAEVGPYTVTRHSERDRTEFVSDHPTGFGMMVVRRKAAEIRKSKAIISHMAYDDNTRALVVQQAQMPFEVRMVMKGRTRSSYFAPNRATGETSAIKDLVRKLASVVSSPSDWIWR